MNGKNSTKALTVQSYLLAFLCTGAPAAALSGNEPPDSYSELQDSALKNAFVAKLSSAGESSTTTQVSFDWPAATAANKNDQVIVHAVQDRGLPRGTEYPTYVFKTIGSRAGPVLIFKTHAGTRI